MRKRTGIAWAAALLLLASIITIAAVRSSDQDTTLSFAVIDSVSGGWVWDLDAELQGRAIKGYFQSDTRPLPGFTFTSLKRGEGYMELSAPSYVDQRIPVNLKKGDNLIPEPIQMTGFEIPDLSTMYIFETTVGSDIMCELRPVDAAGLAIENHPALDIWIGCEISVQMREGVPITEPANEASTRGPRLFKDELEWAWDSTPETLFRYMARIPGEGIAPNSAPYFVIDYLIAVRDPRKISRPEMEQALDEVWEMSDDADFLESLEGYEGITFYLDTTWNFEQELF